jgi:hypothetical protein
MVDKNNIVYGHCIGQEKNPENSEFASYFYIHGELETKNGYDICSFSPTLFKHCINEGITIVNTVLSTEDKTPIPSLLFSSFCELKRRMHGFVVAMDDWEGIKDCIEVHKSTQMHGNESYLSDNFNKTFSHIVNTESHIQACKRLEEIFDYSKLIGYRIDTNQVKSDEIKTEDEAKEVIEKVVETYSDLQLYSIKQLDNCFTAYTYSYPDNLENNINLNHFLLSEETKAKREAKLKSGEKTEVK